MICVSSKLIAHQTCGCSYKVKRSHSLDCLFFFFGHFYVISWCLLLFLFFIFFQFHFSCVSASPINFLTVVSELLVVLFGVRYYLYTVLFTYMALFRYMILFRHTVLFIDTVLFTRNGGNDSRILRCKVGNNGVSKAIVWFCTCLGKFYHKSDKSLRSLGFK